MTFTSDVVLDAISALRDLLWSGPLLIALLGVGIYVTWQTRAVQWRGLPRGFSLFVSQGRTSRRESPVQGDISAFQSVMTALAGSIGTGNIAGIATAIATGGVGALFWMWVMALLGMGTAYAETVLAVLYRRENNQGSMSGGPMYYLLEGLNNRKLAAIYALLASCAILGIGCLVQANAIIDALTETLQLTDRLWPSCGLAMVTGLVIIGGVKSIGKVAGWLVPVAAVLYILACLGIIVLNASVIVPAFKLIFYSAWNGQAAVGGFAGSTIVMAIQNGVQYGIFANEAGLGSLAIAAASARTNEPVEQGLRSAVGVFCATMLVCTLTGLVLAVTQVLGATNSQGLLIKSTPLAILAFSRAWPGLEIVVVVGLVLFAFTTMLAWGYYGEKCCEFLLGSRAGYCYRWIFSAAAVVGGLLKLDLVWAIANLASACMALPNLVGIIALMPVVCTETRRYFRMSRQPVTV